MLTTLMAKRDALMAKFSKVDVADIKDAELRAKAKKLKAKQGGFTLLELLVVVAILAAIAGTATILLQDTDQKAAAALNAVKMDELNKAIHTYPVLNDGMFPNYMDSLLVSGSVNIPSAAAGGSAGAVGGDTSVIELPGTDFTAIAVTPVAKMTEVGITSVMDLNETAQSAACASGNALKGALDAGTVTIDQLYSTDIKGCGTARTIADGSAFVLYTGSLKPIMGEAAATYTTKVGVDASNEVNAGTVGHPVVIVLGLGQSSELFNPQQLGALSTAPTYKSTSANEYAYNRFLGLFKVGEVENPGSGPVFGARDVKFMGLMTPQGKFAAEELAKWEG